MVGIPCNQSQLVRDCKQSMTSDGCWKLALARCAKAEANSSKSYWLTEFGHGRHSCQRSPPLTMPTGQGRTKWAAFLTRLPFEEDATCPLPCQSQRDCLVVMRTAKTMCSPLWSTICATQTWHSLRSWFCLEMKRQGWMHSGRPLFATILAAWITTSAA